jgi:hypothetical protein
MFNIENNLLTEMSVFVEENYQQNDELVEVEMGCNPCSGSCGNNCSGSCAGSCRGTCTFTCQRYNR